MSHSLWTLFFAPVLFLYNVLRNWQMLLFIDRMEEVVDGTQATVFGWMGFNLRFKAYADGYVLVTDCLNPVGRSIAVQLAQRGYNVFCGYTNLKDSHGLKSNLKPSCQSNIIPIALNVTDDASIKNAYNDVSHLLHTNKSLLIGLINTTGLESKAPLENVTSQEWAKVMGNNVIGPFSVIALFLPLLRESNGRIINVSSFTGHTSSPMNGVFAASKIALENATDTLRNEVYSFGISVSLIIPGIMDSTRKYQKNPDPPLSPVLQKSLYGPLEKTVEMIDRQIVKNKLSAKMSERAVDHALFSEHPKARYLVGLDSKLTRWLTWICSDRVLDWGFQVLVNRNDKLLKD